MDESSNLRYTTLDDFILDSNRKIYFTTIT